VWCGVVDPSVSLLTTDHYRGQCTPALAPHTNQPEAAGLTRRILLLRSGNVEPQPGPGSGPSTGGHLDVALRSSHCEAFIELGRTVEEPGLASEHPVSPGWIIRYQCRLCDELLSVRDVAPLWLHLS
jgi:hypothetical protein